MGAFRDSGAVQAHAKALGRRGKALLGLEKSREAAAAFQEGLLLDASCSLCKLGLQAAQMKLAADLVEGGVPGGTAGMPDLAARDVPYQQLTVTTAHDMPSPGGLRAP
jgi:hypothetical protein